VHKEHTHFTFQKHKKESVLAIVVDEKSQKKDTQTTFLCCGVAHACEHHTYRASGLWALMVSKDNATVIPVATGMTTDAWMAWRPAIFNASRARQFVSLLISEDPAAFGWTAATSPDLPIP
jgi:hypothetical protein